MKNYPKREPYKLKASLKEQLKPLKEELPKSEIFDNQEYAVLAQGQQIPNIKTLKEAEAIAAKVNGRVWATITEGGEVSFLYPIR